MSEQLPQCCAHDEGGAKRGPGPVQGEPCARTSRDAAQAASERAWQAVRVSRHYANADSIADRRGGCGLLARGREVLRTAGGGAARSGAAVRGSGAGRRRGRGRAGRARRQGCVAQGAACGGRLGPWPHTGGALVSPAGQSRCHVSAGARPRAEQAEAGAGVVARSMLPMSWGVIGCSSN